jgi:hypothetical protein
MNSFFLFSQTFFVENFFKSKSEERLRSTNVEIHKSRDSLYLSCALIIS